MVKTEEIRATQSIVTTNYYLKNTQILAAEKRTSLYAAATYDAVTIYTYQTTTEEFDLHNPYPFNQSTERPLLLGKKIQKGYTDTDADGIIDNYLTIITRYDYDINYQLEKVYQSVISPSWDRVPYI